MQITASIELLNLCKTISDSQGGKPVFEPLNLCFFPGQVTSILGESGAGKTSLLKLIGGQISATDGEIRLNPPSDFQSCADRDCIYTCLAGSSPLDPLLSLSEQLTASPMTDPGFAAQLIEALELEARQRQPVEQLPQKARDLAGWVWALSRTHPILLIDEIPGLDIETVEQISPLLIAQVTKTHQTILVATRQPALAIGLGQRIIGLGQGKVILDRAIRESGSISSPLLYTFKLQGILEPNRASWFHAIHWETHGNTTILTADVKDQAGLHGLLTRIRDLGMVIDSLQRIHSAGCLPAAQDQSP